MKRTTYDDYVAIDRLLHVNGLPKFRSGSKYGCSQNACLNTNRLYASHSLTIVLVSQVYVQHSNQTKQNSNTKSRGREKKLVVLELDVFVLEPEEHVGFIIVVSDEVVPVISVHGFVSGLPDLAVVSSDLLSDIFLLACVFLLGLRRDVTDGSITGGVRDLRLLNLGFF
jgi:hypothetical protein